MSDTPESAEPKKLYDAIAQELHANHADVETGKLFGMPIIKVGGKVFAGFFQNCMAFKLTGDTHARALGLAGATLLDPSGGKRPMRAWVQVPFEHKNVWEELAEQAIGYVSESRS